MEPYQGFSAYLYSFELQFVPKLLGSGEAVLQRLVPVRSGKLATTRIGRVVGLRIESEDIYAVDYYGYVKKTEGLLEFIESMRERNTWQIKAVRAPVVYLARVKFEQLSDMSPDLAVGFAAFKREILRMRGFIR